MSESRRVIVDVKLHPYREIANWSGAYEVEALTPTAWYRADAITGKVEGDAVTSWLDSSGNSRTLTGTATYRRSPFGDRPWLEFNGTSDGLQSAAALSAVLGSGMIGTVFVVFATSPVDGALWSQDGSFRKSEHITSGKLVRATARDAGGADVYNSSPNDVIPFQPALAAWRYSSSDTNIRSYFNQADATFLGTTSGVQTDTTGTYFVGSENAAGFFTGKIAEVIFFATELSQDERRRVASYLCHKYRLPDNSVRPRIRWRAPFVGEDSTVDGFRPPMVPYQVHLSTSPVEKLVPPPYRTDLSVLGLYELAAEAASIAALGDAQYFIDAAAGYLYLTMFPDPALETAYGEPPRVFVEFLFMSSLEDDPTTDAGLPNLFVTELPRISSEETGGKVNGSIGFRDVMGWFTRSLRKYRWRGTRADITLVSFDGGTFVSSIVAPVYVDDVIPNEGSVAITLKSILAETPIDLQSPWPPHEHSSLLWPFADQSIFSNPVQLGYNSDPATCSSIVVTPDLVSEREATPLDIVVSGEDCFWLDPAVLSGELNDGDQVVAIANKARISDVAGAGAHDFMFAKIDTGPTLMKMFPIIYRENQLNGYPALHFPGGGYGDLQADSFQTFLRTTLSRAIAQRLLVFIVFRADRPGVYPAVPSSTLFLTDVSVGTVTGPRNAFGVNYSTPPNSAQLVASWRDNAGGSHTAPTADFQPGSWHIACYQLDRAALTLYAGLDDADTAAMTSTGATSAEDTTCTYELGINFRGDIAEAIFCDGTAGTDFTQEARRRISSYLRTKYALSDATAAPAVKTYGTYQMLDGGRGDGTYHYAAVNIAGFGFSSQVYAVHRTTGEKTLLTVGTHYLVRGPFVTVISSTYTSATYYLEVALAQITNQGESVWSPARTFLDIWLDWTLPSDSYRLANAPIWCARRSTLQGVLLGSQSEAGILPTLLSGLVANGSYGTTPFQPDPTAAADGVQYEAPAIRRQDLSEFRFSGQTKRTVSKVTLYHSPRFQENAVAWDQASRGTGSEVLEIRTFLQAGLPALEALGQAFCRGSFALPQVNPADLAGCYYFLNSGDALLFDVRTRTLSIFDGQTNLFAPGLLLGQPVLLTFSPYPNEEGEAVSKAMTVERVELQLWPPQLGLTLSDRRGLDANVKGWVTDTLLWSSATVAQKQVTGFWADRTGLVDPDDDRTKGVSVWF